MPTNGISSAADFRQLTRFEVTLPSGRKILMGLPSGKFLLIHLPRFQTLAARLADAAKEPPTEQEVNDFENWMDLLLVDVMVQPRVSLAPKDETELLPREIPALDRLTIFRRAVGEIGADGADLGRFSDGPPGSSLNVGPVGNEIPHSSEPVPGPDGDDGGAPI